MDIEGLDDPWANTRYRGRADINSATDPVSSAYKQFDDAANYARGSVSPESIDRAAARLRARTDQMRRAQDEEDADYEAARGSRNSGRAQEKMQRNRMAANDAYGKGLGEIDNAYWDRMLQAGSVINNSGSGIGQVANNEFENEIRAKEAGAYIDSQKKNDIREAINLYLNHGNTLQDPSKLDQVFRDTLGVDTTGWGFFSPTGTTPTTPTTPTDPLAPGGTTTTTTGALGGGSGDPFGDLGVGGVPSGDGFGGVGGGGQVSRPLYTDQQQREIFSRWIRRQAPQNVRDLAKDPAMFERIYAIYTGKAGMYGSGTNAVLKSVRDLRGDSSGRY